MTDGGSGAVLAGARAELCLDFANTRAWRGSVAVEELHNFHGLIEWGAGAGIVDQGWAATARAWGEQQSRRAAAVFAEAIALREAIYAIVQAVARGQEAAADDLRILNQALAQTPARNSVAAGDTGYGWRIRRDRITVVNLLAPVLWSAGDLLTGPLRTRVRLCANAVCLWAFVDDSRAGARRWCSMGACGNRAKARRHYLRRKGNQVA